MKVGIGIIGGSGLDDPDILEDRNEVMLETPFGSPSDALIIGKILGVNVVLLARHGRKHNISPSFINYRANLWAMRELGCEVIVATTACGSLREEIPPGQLLLLNSFIDRTNKRETTFFDPRVKQAPVGVCHFPMDMPFSVGVRNILFEAGQSIGVPLLDKGTCVTIEGPRFSTKPESLMFRMWGADVVNMTTVPEVILAKELGILYAAVAMATDYDCWRDNEAAVSVEGVLQTFKKNAENVKKLLVAAVPLLSAASLDQERAELKSLIEGSIMGGK